MGTCGGTGGSLCDVPATNVTAAPGSAANSEVISWQAPASGPAPASYVVTVTDNTAGGSSPPVTVPATTGTMSTTVVGLTTGDSYTVTVEPTGGDIASIATVSFTGP